MKAIVFDTELKYLEDYPVPDPGPNEALVKVLMAGICNTDLEITKGYMGFKGVPGHEFVGLVEKVNGPDQQMVGQRVVGEINGYCGTCDYCQKEMKTHCPNRFTLGIMNKDGAFAEYLTLPVSNLWGIPGTVYLIIDISLRYGKNHSMARIARVVAAGMPHHVTQRGNRRMQTFFYDQDYHKYIDLMAESCRRYAIDIWAYCLMPNHVHLIAVPQQPESLRHALGEAHRRYTRHINFREKWKGHLWQERFASYPMSENHLLAAVRYVELNPVRVGLAKEPWLYKWSSAAAHVKGLDDKLVSVAPLLDMVEDWRSFIRQDIPGEEIDVFHSHERTGRPLGNEGFIKGIEESVSRVLRRQKPGPKKKKADS